MEKQTGIVTQATRSPACPSRSTAARPFTFTESLQEALNNVARPPARAKLKCACSSHRTRWTRKWKIAGKGGVAVAARSGAQVLVAMRERAELLRGTIEFTQPPQGGTLVRMRVPREGNEANVG